MSQDLNLDENQKAKLLEIFSATDVERDALRKKHEEQIRQDICSLKQSTTQQIKHVLTAQQATEFDKMMASREAHREGHKRRHGKEGRPPMDCEETGA